MKKNCFAAISAVLTIVFVVVSVSAQTKNRAFKDDQKSRRQKSESATADQKNQFKVAREGVGIEGIRVGKSTINDAVKKFGTDYKRKTYGKYSNAIVYSKLGLAFYACQTDKKQEIFDIEIRQPYQAKTARGIILGKSTLPEIIKAYGKSKDGLEYPGVSFFYANFKGKKTVTVIDVVEKSGIRQCKENK